MAVSQTTSGSGLATSATLSNLGLTICGWFMARAQNGSGNNTIFGHGTSSANASALDFDSANSLDQFQDGSTSTYLCPLTFGKWYFGGYTIDGSGNVLGFIGSQQPDNRPMPLYFTPVTGTATSVTTTVRAMNDVFGLFLNGAVENVMAFSAALTSAQLQAIAYPNFNPTGIANLWGYWPLTVFTDLTDHSGNGRNLTGSGTHTTVAGPLAQVAQLAWGNKPVAVQCVGNSRTAGYNGSVDAPANSYPTKIATFIKSVTFTNRGHDTFTTAQLLSASANDVQWTAGADNMVMFDEGVNDANVSSFTGAQCITAMTGAVQFFQALGFRVMIGTCLPYNATTFPTFTNNTATNTLNAGIVAGAPRPFGADAYSDNASDSFWANLASVMVDGLHPTAAGYLYWAGENQWALAVRRAFIQFGGPPAKAQDWYAPPGLLLGGPFAIGRPISPAPVAAPPPAPTIFPWGGDMALVFSRAQLSLQRYLSGEPLPAPPVSVSRGFDVSIALARGAPEQAAPTADVPPPRVFSPTGYEAATALRRADLGPPRYLAAQAVPPSVQAPTGFEHADPGARMQSGPSRHVSGEPVPAEGLSSAWFDAPWLPSRAAGRPAQASGGDPETPSMFTATAFETATAPRRPDTGPQRHLPGESTPPQTVSGAGIDVSPAISRPLSRMVLSSGGVILPVSLVGGFDGASVSQRVAVRALLPGVEGVPPRVFTATGYETTAPGARPQTGPPRHLSADPLRSPVLPQLVRGGDVSPAAWRPSLPPPPASGQVVTPRTFTATGYETTAPGARPQAGPPRHVPSDPPTTSVVRGAGIENAQPVQRRDAHPVDLATGTSAPLTQAQTRAPTDNVTIRGRVFAPLQQFGGEAFAASVWTSNPESASTQRRQERPRHTGGEGAAAQPLQVFGFDYQEPLRPRTPREYHAADAPVPGARLAQVAPDPAIAPARAMAAPDDAAGNAVKPLQSIPIVGVFGHSEPATRRPARQPPWIDADGFPAPRIMPITLQIPREFEIEMSLPIQSPAQFQVTAPQGLGIPRGFCPSST